MKKQIVYIIFVTLFMNVTNAQIHKQEYDNIFYSSYEFNKHDSKKEERIVKKIDKILRKEFGKNPLKIILIINHGGAYNPKADEHFDIIEFAFQTFHEEFIYSNSYTRKILNEPHLFVRISTDNNIRKKTIKTFKYIIKNIEVLKNKEKRLREKAKNNDLTDEDIDSFDYTRIILKDN